MNIMNKQNIRYVFIFAIFIVGLALFNSWQSEQDARKIAQLEAQAAKQQSSDIPTTIVAAEATPATHTTVAQPHGAPVLAEIDPDRIVSVTTDVYNVKIDRLGGDLVYMDLPKYPQTQKDPQGFVLLDEAKARFYVVQSGLLSDNGPDSNTLGRQLYRVDSHHKIMDSDESILNVDLHFRTNNGVDITKRYIFTRGSYEIRVHYIVNNNGATTFTASPFGRIKRTAPIPESSGMFGAMRTYTGAAVNTPDKKYQKLSFSDMQKQSYKEDVRGGWAAMVEHYFATAIVPAPNQKNYYRSEDFGGDTFGITFVSEPVSVAPGKQEIVETKIYAGPEIAAQLQKVAPGLELTIDYGFLWFLCKPIFWLLKTIYDLIGNWGVAIILTTVVIKAMFFKLSASSYKSMGNMRKLQPKIEALKKRYPEDKQKFSSEMLELYRKEKVNPLGGCLPVLIQIPVFIALYYVLLESVELRQAPFMLWIQDLSAKDPYYVLPIIMGLSMLVQQRLNPAPPDPLQAKVLMIMPIFFTFLFLQFPAGLVLYWVVNNLLSILQQWWIMRSIPVHK